MIQKMLFLKRVTMPIMTVIARLFAMILLALALGAPFITEASSAAAAYDGDQRSHLMAYENYERPKKHASDQRLAELQALIAMSSMNGAGYGHGHIDPFAAGRRRRRRRSADLNTLTHVSPSSARLIRHRFRPTHDVIGDDVV